MSNEVYINITVGDFNISRTGNEKIAAGNRNLIWARFIFSGAWIGLNHVAVFKKEGLEAANVPVENGKCRIPNEFMAETGTVAVSVYAGDLRTVNTVELEVVESGYCEGVPPLPPEPKAMYIQSSDSTVPFVREKDEQLEYFARGEWQTLKSPEPDKMPLWTPEVSAEGIISWSRSESKDAPASRDIKGEKGIQGPKGEKGEQGIQGNKGDAGSTGIKGDTGASATVSIGATTTLEAGNAATVANVGTASAAIFNFGIPKGADGSDAKSRITLFASGTLSQDTQKSITIQMQGYTYYILSFTDGGPGTDDMYFMHVPISIGLALAATSHTKLVSNFQTGVGGSYTLSSFGQLGMTITYNATGSLPMHYKILKVDLA